VRGKIHQIQEGSGVTVMRLAVTKDPYIGWNYNDVIWVDYLGTTDYVEVMSSPSMVQCLDQKHIPPKQVGKLFCQK
jgi:hypothetical protein